ncbi:MULTISPECIES: PaaI family thioesterase [Phenylobacterium]|uniref:Uncharacterized protein (TIGR00369 family) n=1 Tax=Phenylobacterium koreense TaxID=266125 RepID=A0ABV2EGP3_9CAUL
MTWATDRLEALAAGEASPPPVTRTLKLGLFDEWGEGWVRKTWAPHPDLATEDGSLFGGYVAALADQALAFAAMTVVPDGAAFRTINLNLNFVRMGRNHGLNIEARVVSRSRRLITARVEFRDQAGVLLAEATGQQLVMPYEDARARDAPANG